MSDRPSIGDETETSLPGVAKHVAEEQPALWEAFTALGAASAAAGPMDEKTRRLVGLALALGGGSEGATHSHARRAVAEGISAEELDHVAFLAITTLGWPQAMRGLSWIRDVTQQK